MPKQTSGANTALSNKYGACVSWSMVCCVFSCVRVLCCSADGTPQCCSCNKLRPVGEEWVTLQDWRQLCLECLDTMVVDTKDAQPLYDEVRACPGLLYCSTLRFESTVAWDRVLILGIGL